MKIALVLIARNADATLRKTIESARPYVDEIIIGEGGPSDDNTHDLAIELADRVFQIEWRDDFAYARNIVWQYVVDGGADWAIWLDADDELVGGDQLRDTVEQADAAGLTCLYATYEYERDERGNLTSVLVRERVVKNPALWSWTGRVHEVLQLDEGEEFNAQFTEAFKVVHQHERPRDKGERNLRLLYQELAETEPDPQQRVLLYLFRENWIRGNLAEGLKHGRRYLARLPAGQPNDEAGQIAAQMAKAARAMGDFDAADKLDLLSTRLAPTFPDGYFGLAETAYHRADYAGVVRFTQAAGAFPLPKTGLIVNELDYTYKPLYFLGLAYAQMGDQETALENLRKARWLLPDPEIIKLVAAIEQEHDMQGVLAAYKTLAKHLMRWDEWLKVRQLLGVAPKLIEQHPDVREMVMRVVQQTAHVDDPQVMIDHYRANPGWMPMEDAMVLSATWAQHPRLKWARKVMCEPPKYILDMGSSDGFISLPLAKDGHYVTGYDLDPRTIEVANRRAREWDMVAGVGTAGRTTGTARYKVGGVEDLADNETYDVALAFEIIEHLVDPKAFLDQLDKHVQKVALTTPFLAWERGQLTDAQIERVEPKGHLRIFDLEDVERLVAHRGRVLDLYREPWGDTGWIFASYRPGERPSGTVTFLAPGTIEEWSPRKLAEQGLGGSETALIRVAEELAAKYQILPTTFGRIDNPGYYGGARYRQWESYLPEVSQDATVAWRWPEAADLPLRNIDMRLLLWVHDVDFGDRLTPIRAARFNQIVVLSQWHREHFLAKYPFVPEEKVVIIGNGVDPDRFKTKPVPKREPHRVVYTSSADRGLDVILEHVWPKVVERVPDAELHVYYGWQNFKALEVQPGYTHLGVFRERVARLMLDTTNVVQHGRVTQTELASELRRASVWLGPSHDFDETFCISAVEAQLAGAIPVHSGRAALAETVKSGVVIEGRIGDEGIAEQWVEAIVAVLTAPDKALVATRRQVARDAGAVGWEQVADLWHALLFPG